MSENIQKSPLPCGGGLGVGETQSIKQGYKQTSLGILPQEWEVVRLGEVGDIVGGGTPDTTNSAFWNGEILWLTPTEIKQKYIFDSERKITQKGLLNSSAKLLPKNTILITTRATIGDIGIATQELSTNQGFQSFISGEKVNFEFMYYLLGAKKREFIALANGSTFLEISAKTIRQIQIPLPPLAEQEKIAQILGIWDKGISVLKSLIEAKTKRKKALMQRLLTPPKTSHTDFSSCHSDKVCHTEPFSCHTERSEVSKNKGVDFVDTLAFSKHQYDEVLDSCNSATLCHTEGVARSIQKDDLQGNAICLDSSVASLPQNDRGKLHNVKNKPNESSLRFAEFTDKWQEMRLGDICEIVTGTTPSTKQKEFYDNGTYPWITPTDIGEQREINTSTRYLSSKGIKQGRFIPKGSLLVTCIASIGKNAILTKDGSCNQQINAILPTNKHDMTFLYYLMEYKSEYLIGFAGKSATHILNKTNFSNLIFKLPTLAEQKKIAQVLSACDKEIELLKSKFQCLKTQKKGLMQRLLNGEVRVKC